MADILKFVRTNNQNSQFCFGKLIILGYTKNIRRLAKYSIKNYNKGLEFKCIQELFLKMGIYVSRITTLYKFLKTKWNSRVIKRLGKAAKKKGLVFPLHRLLYSELPPHMISFEYLEYYSNLNFIP